jgi:hypothetical protein
MSYEILDLQNPEKEIKLGPVTLVLKGVDFKTEQIIESIKYKKPADADEANVLGAEYVYRMISYTVKDIKGIKLKDPETGEISDFKPTFTSTGQLSLYSYDVLMRVLISNGHDIAGEVKKFYDSVTQLSGVEVENKKKD